MSAYTRTRTGVKSERVVVLASKAEVEAIDAWAAPAGMESRGAAIRFLVQEGLKAVKAAGTAAGAVVGAETPAAESNNAALARGVSVNHGTGDAADECDHR